MPTRNALQVRLTPHQRRLVQDIEAIASLLKLDYRDVCLARGGDRTAALELIVRRFVISEVIMSYTLVDEYLSMCAVRYYFEKQRSFIRLWKTKKFRLFNHCVLEELNLMAKLRLIKSIHRLPKSVTADIEKLNALRNALAHAFFPENLKKYKPQWKGKSIFSLSGLRSFVEDIGKISAYFLPFVYKEAELIRNGK